MKNKHIISAKIIAWIVLIASFIFKIWLIVWQFVANKFLVPPGGDPVQHLYKIQAIINGELTDFSYPPLFHYAIAGIVKFTGCDPVQTMIVVAIILFAIAIPVFYLLARNLFGFWTAFWATLVYIYASSYPLIAFLDGNYPEMLCYTIITPIILLCFVKATKKLPGIYAVIGSILLVLMAGIHHLSLFVTAIVTVVFLLASVTVSALYKDKATLKRAVTSFVILVLFGIIIYIIARLTFGEQIVALFRALLDQGVDMNYSTPVDYNSLYVLVNPVGSILGVAGLLYMLATYRKNSSGKLLIVVWIVCIWILSRSNLSGVAPRYLREIALPLSVSAGFLVAKITQIAKFRWQKIAVAGLVGYLLFVGMTQVNYGPALLPEGMKSNVWYSQDDIEKTETLSNLQANSTIIANPSNPYINYYVNNGNNNITMIQQQHLPEFASLSAENQISTVEKLVNGANYIFIGKTPSANMDEKSFAEFIGYANTTLFLENYVLVKQCPLVRSFDDGSALYSTACAADSSSASAGTSQSSANAVDGTQ